MSGDGGSPGQQQNGGQPQGPTAPGPEAPGPGGVPGAPGHWPGYGPAFGQPGWSTGGGWGQGRWGGVPVAPKPGVLPLRPLGFAEMFGAVFDTVRRYVRPLYLPLSVVVGIGAVPLLAVAFLISGSLYDGVEDFPDITVMDPTDTQVWNLARPLLLFFGMSALVGLALYVVAGPLATVVLRAATLGRKLTAAQAWQEARPRLTASVATLALVYGSLLLLEALLMAGSVLFGDVLLLPFLLVGCGAFYVTFRLAPQIPVAVLEESGARTAVRRAWQLNRNNWWRSLGLTALVSLLGAIGTTVINFPLRMVVAVMLPVGAAASGDGGDTRGTITVVLVLAALVSLVTMLATSPLVPLVNGVLYIDRRIRSERLDIALAEAAGIRFAESSAYPQYAPVPAQYAPAQPAPAQPAPAQPDPAQPASAPAQPGSGEPGRPAEPPAGKGPEGS
ncbi:hypothetical protein [Kitasatospora sp. NPDC004272]